MELALRASACPACDVVPSALAVAEAARLAQPARLMLSVPEAHCAACISTLEQGLEALPGVRAARMNLTLRRIAIEAEPEITAAELIPEVARLGYVAHELDAGMLAATEVDQAGRELLMRLAVAGFAMMNIMLLSIAVWAGAEAATRDLFHWISAAIALPTIAFSGQPFFRSAYAALRVGRTNMDVPISIAMLLASGTSLYETFYSGEYAYFDAAVSLTFFLLIGRYLDHRTRAAARSAARELAALEVPRALRVSEAGEALVAVAEIRPGDLVRVLPGGRVPVDGMVEEGTSEMDRSLLTGESLPGFVSAGVAVAAGEVNLTGPLLVRVTAAGQDSALQRIAALVAVAEMGRGRYASIADRVVRYYTPAVHTVAFLTMLGWVWATGDLRLALNIAAAVLIITCPCALGLAVPAVMTAASGRLFRRGLLIKDGTALERLADVDCVVFDKTGTLTMGAPEVLGLDGHSEGDLALAAGLSAGSAHPLAQALSAALRARGVVAAPLTGIREVPGYGVEAQLGQERVRLGRADWLGAPAAEATSTWLQRGHAPAVAFTFADSLRPGAEALVSTLVARGIAVHLVSGDADAPVAALAAKLGITAHVARALPEAKAAYVAALRDQGRRVLMIGDGLNDTAALAGAHVSISPASALDAARTASDIVLLGQSLEPVAEALSVARQAVARIKENIVISNLYNMVAVPLAVLGYCTPLFAALAMSSSSISVTLNALRLRR